jgi:hypothetical protein
MWRLSRTESQRSQKLSGKCYAGRYLGLSGEDALSRGFGGRGRAATAAAAPASALVAGRVRAVEVRSIEEASASVAGIRVGGGRRSEANRYR